MILNPILMLILAVISFVAGIADLVENENWLSGVPFVVFIFLFCLSLLTPEVKMAQLVDGCRVAFKTLRQAIKRFEMGRARRPKSMIDG